MSALQMLPKVITAVTRCVRVCVCVCVCVCVRVSFSIIVCCRVDKILKKIAYMESNISISMTQGPFYSLSALTFIFKVKLFAFYFFLRKSRKRWEIRQTLPLPSNRKSCVAIEWRRFVNFVDCDRYPIWNERWRKLRKMSLWTLIRAIERRRCICLSPWSRCKFLKSIFSNLNIAETVRASVNCALTFIEVDIRHRTASLQVCIRATLT